MKSSGQFGGLRSLREGHVYFVSAKVRGYGIATWVAGGKEFKTGGGVLIGIDPVARRVSDAGVDLRPSLLASWGLTSGADGYAASRACVK